MSFDVFAVIVESQFKEQWVQKHVHQHHDHAEDEQWSWMKECVGLHAQDICHYYSDKNVDAVPDEERVREWDDLTHEARCMKQKECWKASIKSFWIDQKNDQSLHDADKSQQELQSDELNAVFVHVQDED